MKLHLGCGTKIIDGYVNVDIRQELNCDIVDDIKTLTTFQNNVAEEIYACHVLEHFSRHEYKEVLIRWFEVLEKGGILKISVPNLEKVFEQYSKGISLKTLMGLLYGGQTYPENYHYVGFDFETLKNDLLEIGFSEIGLWDWKLTEHSHIDDFSQCYLPHMDKENGTLMSLNIMAVK
jgi:predicted SAM-dependent methyltransferase